MANVPLKELFATTYSAADEGVNPLSNTGATLPSSDNAPFTILP